ncbi:MAG: fumarylacetoacetate hydrolase family protein [Planctomycetes bacterium]|nr:fumarylacetoacetate hydrolase family protein [Planctomycetota bacterium]
MQLATYQSDSGPRVAGVRDDGYVDLSSADPQLPAAMSELLALGREGLERTRRAVQSGAPLSADRPIKLLAPVPRPGKVICVGLNYADHAAESGAAPPEEPVIFNKFPTSVCGHEDPIVLPRLSEQVDYEAELVVVIGEGGRHIPEERALEHVAGYCCGHDVSARDWQLGKPGRQWLLGKTFDTFAPFGPHLVTADEVGDPGDLGIRLRLGGRTMQDSSTRQLIFSIPKLLAYISSVCRLEPGDVLFTGTPPGVGMARKPPVFLQPGDVVEVEIDRLGTLRNPVTAEV